MGFDDSLKFGQIAESLISKWLMDKGMAVMPAYQVEKQTGKGPQLFLRNAGLVAPDLLVFSDNGIKWIEAKHKTRFTWWRQTRAWTTGIDLRHYGEYLHVAKATKLPVILLFFHSDSTPSASDLQYGCPAQCPTGLFGGELFDLVTKEDHRTTPKDPQRQNGILGHGHSGMVYWNVADLSHLATKDQVISVSAGQRLAA